MDGDWSIDAAIVPAGLPEGRLHRWCIARTIRDVRLARARARHVSRRAAERLFLRRWGGRGMALAADGRRRVAALHDVASRRRRRT